MRNVLDRCCRENKNTHFMFNNCFPKIAPFMRCRKIYWRLGATNDVTTWRIRVACWICKAMCTYARPRVRVPTCTRKHAHTGHYVILIAFPQQQWFRERAPVLRYKHIVCLALFSENTVRMLDCTGWRKGHLTLMFNTLPLVSSDLCTTFCV